MMHNLDREPEFSEQDREVRSRTSTSLPPSSILSDAVPFHLSWSEETKATQVAIPDTVSTRKSDESKNEYMTINSKKRDVDPPYQNLRRFNSFPVEDSQLASKIDTLLIEYPQDPHNTPPKQHRASVSAVVPQTNVTAVSTSRNGSISLSSFQEKRNSIVSPRISAWQDDTSLDSQSRASTMVMNQLYGKPEKTTSITSDQVVQCLPMFYCLETGKAYVDLNTTHTFPMHQLVEVNVDATKDTVKANKSETSQFEYEVRKFITYTYTSILL